jgi:hypothetical protein
MYLKKDCSQALKRVNFLLDLFLDPENVSDMVLRNVG